MHNRHCNLFTQINYLSLHKQQGVLNEWPIRLKTNQIAMINTTVAAAFNYMLRH